MTSDLVVPGWARPLAGGNVLLIGEDADGEFVQRLGPFDADRLFSAAGTRRFALARGPLGPLVAQLDPSGRVSICCLRASMDVVEPVEHAVPLLGARTSLVDAATDWQGSLWLLIWDGHWSLIRCLDGYRVPLDGGAEPGGALTASPLASHLFVTLPGQPRQTTRVDLVSGERRVVVEDCVAPPVCSPDGRHLAWAEAAPGSARVMLAPVSAPRQVRVVAMVGAVTDLAFSRDGGHLCVLSGGPGQPSRIDAIDLHANAAPFRVHLSPSPMGWRRIAAHALGLTGGTAPPADARDDPPTQRMEMVPAHLGAPATAETPQVERVPTAPPPAPAVSDPPLAAPIRAPDQPLEAAPDAARGGRLGPIVAAIALCLIAAGAAWWFIARAPEAESTDQAAAVTAPRRSSPGTVMKARKGIRELRPSQRPADATSPKSTTAVTPPSAAPPSMEGPRPGYVRVPAGRFVMGSPETEAGRDPDETQRPVDMPTPLLVKTTEVTQDEWFAVMQTWPAYHADCGDCPVERVSWLDAVEYANRISKADGFEACYALAKCKGTPGTGCSARRGSASRVCTRGYRCRRVEVKGPRCTGYRLPTEAEWEYVGRAGATTPWPGAHYDVDVGRVAWIDETSDDHTHPVGRLKPNAWGLYDMSGNVWEWTETGRDGQYVDRGGMYRSSAEQVRLARRNDSNPADRRGYEVGFRLVRSLPARVSGAPGSAPGR